MKDINNSLINRLRFFKLRKYAAFIRSCLDSALVITVGYVAGSEEAGHFYANYYVLFVFGFSAIALETLSQTRKNILYLKSTYKLIFYPYFLTLFVLIYFNFENLFSLIIIGIASILSILNSIAFVEEEVKLKDNKILLSAVFPRLFSISFIVIFFWEYQNNWLNIICITYLLKESVEFFINIYSYKNISHLSRIKNGYLENSLGKNWVADVLLASLSTAFDPILRFAILIAIGPQFVFIYEYMTRIPRIISSSWMQITRHTLFSENSNSKKIKSNYFLSFSLILINLVAIFIINNFDLINDSILKILIIIISSFNLLLAVEGYNNHLKRGRIKYLNFSYLLTLFTSILILVVFQKNSSVIYLVILCNSLCLYIAMNNSILKYIMKFQKIK